jgi:hypothetical protein
LRGLLDDEGGVVRDGIAKFIAKVRPDQVAVAALPLSLMKHEP